MLYIFLFELVDNKYQRVPLPGGSAKTFSPCNCFWFSSLKALSHVHLAKNRYFPVIFRRFRLIFASLCPPKISGVIKIMRCVMCGNHHFSLSIKKFFYHEYFDGYIRKTEKKKRQKWSTLSTLGPNISAHRFFADIRSFGSKLEI